jgi:membrane-associated phospholipid phosphatase
MGARIRHKAAGAVFALACVFAVILIAGNRVFLGAHTAAETVAGLAIGLACLGAFWKPQ